jgi:hypothetical protein
MESLSPMPGDLWIPRLVIVFVIFLLLVSIRRRREAIRHRIRRVIVVEGVYVGVAYVMSQVGRTGTESLLGGIVAALIVNQWMPGRSRHIPASVRRRKIAEHELRTGKKFNPRKYELDHEVAFSKGGSHTEDNLRVVERSGNRSKGSKSPWWDFLGH